MACFLVPTAEAIVTTIVSKSLEAKAAKAEKAAAKGMETAAVSTASTEAARPAKSGFLRKLRWLSYMLWGGSALLAYEHIWHGEVVPWFPFLTAASDAAARAEMLHEMATVGVSMALLVTLFWGALVAVSSVIERRTADAGE